MVDQDAMAGAVQQVAGVGPGHAVTWIDRCGPLMTMVVLEPSSSHPPSPPEFGEKSDELDRVRNDTQTVTR